jgi:hypothetical protein
LNKSGAHAEATVSKSIENPTLRGSFHNYLRLIYDHRPACCADNAHMYGYRSDIEGKVWTAGSWI